MLITNRDIQLNIFLIFSSRADPRLGTDILRKEQRH